MRIIYLLVVLLLMSAKVMAQTTIWHEDFEEGGNNTYNTNQSSISVLTNDWSYSKDNRGRLRLRTVSGRKAATLDVESNGNYSTNYLIATVKVKDYTALKLSFDLMPHADEDHGTDRVWVRRGNDNSQSWVEIYNWTSLSDNNWHSISNLDVSAVLAAQPASDYIQIRFGQYDNYAANTDGVSIDDVSVSGVHAQVNGDFQSRSSVNWGNNSAWYKYNAGAWNTTSDDPGLNSNVNLSTIQAGHNITLNANRPKASYSLQEFIVHGTLSYRTDNVRNLTVENSLTGSGTVDMSGGNQAHTLTVGGDFEPARLISGAGSVIFNGSASQNIGGFTYNNLSVSGGGDKVLSGDVTINGTLNLGGAKIILGDHDLILADGASIIGTYSSTNMIVTNGTGRVIKQGNSVADYQMLYPLGTGANYSPFEITSIACSDATGSIEMRAVSGIAPGPPAADAKDLNKYWEITQTGLTVSSVDVSYDYDDAEQGSGGDLSKYEPYLYANTIWQIPSGASGVGVKPCLATSVPDIAGIWTVREHVEINTYYSFQSGNWSDWDSWTLDPSGMLLDNDGHNTPNLAKDQVVIKNGKTITMNLNNVHCEVLKVDGRLDLAQTTGHTFDVISGSGRILMAADNFPSFTDCSAFVDAGKDEGTVVYYGNSNYNISGDNTFYNVEVSMDANNRRITLLGDFTVNGNLSVLNGDLRINDGTDNVRRRITVGGDLFIDANGEVITGDGNPGSGLGYHQLIIKRNFTNNGSAKFTNRTSAGYTSFDSKGAVEVIFDNDVSDQKVILNGPTVFNKLTCNKGSDDTYILDISASAVANFKLFGQNNQAMPWQGVLGGDRNPDKALSLLAGTIKLGSNIVIPSLSSAGAYDIDEDARLWLYANADVNFGEKTGSNNWLAVYGVLQVSDNASFTEDTYFGLTLRSKGKLNVEGGTVNLTAFRTSTWGGAGDHVGAYVQSGGVTNINHFRSGFASFHLPFGTNVFHMSGGVLHVKDQCDGGDEDDFALIINSSEENYNVTGGDVIIDMENNEDYRLNSRAPFWNLIVRNTNANSRTFSINSYTESGDETESMPALPLVVLNDLTLEGTNSPTFTTNNVNVSVGRNFRIEEGAKYNFGTNTTIFNGTENGELYIGHNVHNSSYEQHFYNVTINKPADKSLTVTGDERKEIQYQIDNSLERYRANLMHVEQNLNLESGILNQGKHNIRLWGTSTIKKDGQCGVLDHEDALIMFKGGTINTEKGAILGNIKINPDASFASTISFTSDVYVKRISYASGSINLGSYNLRVDELDNYVNNMPYAITDGSDSKLFYSDGKASDGGLSILITGNETFAFPIGVSGKYTPAELSISDFVNEGYITVTPVDDVLNTTDLSGGNILDYYWRVKHDSFTNLPKALYKYVYSQSDVTGVGNPEQNYYSGRVLSGTPYTREYINDKSKVDGTNNIITYDNGSGGGTPLVNANYTAGNNSRFAGTVEIFYSVDHNERRQKWGFWQNQTTWVRADRLKDLDGNGTIDTYEYHDSRQDRNNSGYPQAGDIAVIGWVPWSDAGRSTEHGKPHCVWVRQPESCAEVVFTQMLDNAGNPTGKDFRHNYQFRPTLCLDGSQANPQLTTNLVRGEGAIWVRFNTDPDFTTMDLGEFAKEDSAYVMYENTGWHRTYNNTPLEFPNLIVSNDGWGQNNYNITFSKDIKTNGNLEIMGNANLVLPTGATGDISIGNDLIMYETTNTSLGSLSGGGAEFIYQNSGTNRKVIIGRDILLNNTNNRIYVSGANGSARDHELHVGRNIIQTKTGTGLNLCDGRDNDRITLYMEGNEDGIVEIKAGTQPDLYRLVVNKGSDQSKTITFKSNFDLQGYTNDATKSIELQNGTLVLDHSAIDINLTTAGDNFSIPSTAALEIKQGTVNATGNSGISLDGLLKVSGGTVDMRGGDNPIVYSTSGNAQIDLSNGNLFVGSQIRRGASTTEGILNYNQSGGILEVGENAAGVAERGIFEILNTGSSFNYTGGAINIINDRRVSPSIASLYFAPDMLSITDGAIINFGATGTIASADDFTIYGGKPLNNIRLNNNANLKTDVVSLSLNENLIINSGTSFNANGLELNIKGDLVNEGTFNSNNNTTTFEGSANQQIIGATTFYKLVKKGTSSMEQDADVIVQNKLNLEEGAWDLNNNDLTALDDMYIDIEVNSTGGQLIVQGTSGQQNIDGSPILDVLTLDNSDGLYASNSVTINKDLNMQQGIFDIDNNLLIIGKGAAINATAAFSERNMIQTNISFTDAGIRKIFPAITSATNFVYPIGSQGKYTPVEFAINKINDGASIRVKSANERQPTIQNGLGESFTPVNEEEDNVLQYYWILDAEGIIANGLDANVVMTAYEEQEKVTAPHTVSEYITARLRSNSSGLWEKYGDAAANDYNETTHQLSFTLQGDNNQVDGDYTAGVATAIPDHVATYVSQKDGSWADTDVWLPKAPVGGPRGAIVQVDHDVSVSTNSIISYQTTINNGGVLNLAATSAHRLGNVHGKGTLYLEKGDLPAGAFDDFFAAGNGTIEYGGTGTYDILSALPNINALVVSGSGVRRLPNIELQLWGDLTIDGPELLNEYSQKLNLKKDVYFESGTYTPKTGVNCIVNFNGTQAQSINGAQSFTGTNAFYKFAINNNAGLTLNRPVEIKNHLDFGVGIINSSNTNTITVTNSASASVSGGKASSYVAGPMRKLMNAGDSFEFPVGNTGRYGNIEVNGISNNGIWEVQYFNHNATVDGYDVNSFTDPVKFVSHNEYWRVQAPADGQSARLTLHWDDLSGVTGSLDMRVVNWETTSWKSLNTNAPNASGKTITLNSVLNFGSTPRNQFVTFGAISIPKYDWKGGATGEVNNWFNPNNWASGTIPDAGTDITIGDEANDPIVDATGVAQVNDLTINTDATLTLKPGSQMTINGDLTTNNNNLIIENTNDDPTSLITYGAVNGAVTMKWTYDNLNWWFIGHGISNPTMAAYEGIRTAGNDYAMYDYMNNGAWDKLSAKAGTFDLAAEPELKGYLFKVKDPAGEVVQLGTLNNNPQYNKTLLDEWQIIANPYPSHYQLPSDPAGTGDFANTEGTVYVTTSTRNSDKVFETFNTNSGLSSPETFTGILAPSQAFYVKTSTGKAGSDVTMRASNRIVDGGKTSLKSGKKTNVDVLRIHLSNESGASDEAVIAIRENGEKGFTRMDSEQKFNTNGLSYIYSMVEGNQAVINVLPHLNEDFSQELGILAKTGQHELSITGINSLTIKYELILEDKLLGVMHKLDEVTPYVFNSDAGTFEDRFVLHLNESKTDVPTGIDGTDKESTVSIIVEGDSRLIVNCAWKSKYKQVTVYNMLGSQLLRRDFDGEVFIEDLRVKTDVYIVKVTGGNYSYQQKVFVK
jgi:hypothetical protein